MWTDEVVVKLKALWTEGLSAREIGDVLGFGKNAVLGKVHRLNLPARRGVRNPPAVYYELRRNIGLDILKGIECAPSEGVKFSDVAGIRGICKYPKGKLWCGLPAEESYCPKCHDKVYQATTPKINAHENKSERFVGLIESDEI